MELHTSIGPARTTISGIAERAGVQRHTVYAHFPDERELFRSCAGLWQSRNPFPDVSAWAAIDDTRRRTETALDAVYRYYERTARDLVPVFEHAERVPAMEEALAAREEQLASIARLLTRGRGARGRRRMRIVAAVTHALRLETWRSLVESAALTRNEAVALMAGLVELADAPARSRRLPASAVGAGGDRVAQARRA